MQAGQSSSDGWIGVTCLFCPTGAELVPEAGPGPGWIYLDGRGYACPACAARAHDSEVAELREDHGATRAKLTEAERLRDKHDAEIKRLRGWIETFARGDYGYSREDFTHYALRGYEVPPPDNDVLGRARAEA